MSSRSTARRRYSSSTHSAIQPAAEWHRRAQERHGGSNREEHAQGKGVAGLPAVHHLKVFGCIAYVLNTTPHLKKLEDRGRKMIFIGYECGSKAYRAYDPTTRRVHVTRDVVFDENAQWDWGSGAEQGDAGSHDDMFTLEYTVGTRYLRSSMAPSRYLMMMRRDRSRSVPIDAPLRFRKIDDIVGLASPRGLVSWALIAEELHAVSSDEPVSFAEAEGHLSWRKAMEEEMASIEENRTWSLVDLPHGRRAIRLKWVYKVKRDENEAVTKYKACLVVKSYAQRQGSTTTRCSHLWRGWTRCAFSSLSRRMRGERCTTWMSSRHS
ncbi:unnamed protein product [Spirodela intermedia]|uniref:Uncharacterized protein n=1 Tax=Spirodela intermedia TaxID=51605 RepID=A0A7I8IRZ4_SPIIN|nr:unnamed protein product [Spirodela intermedia]CAA6660307.1 unnamed protein product [Spirodela intermedia]